MRFPGADFFVLSFFLIGVVLCSISLSIYLQKTRLAEKGIETKGTVIGLHRVKRNAYPQAPSIRYFTRHGRTLVFHSSEGRNPPEYRIGEEITLYYDEKNPSQVQLKGNYLMAYVFSGIGSIFLLLTVWEIGATVKTIWRWVFG